MEIRKLTPDEYKMAATLIWKVFFEFVAPTYSPQGVDSFRKFITDPNTQSDLEFFGAFAGGQLVGAMAVQDSRRHICCFFVDSAFQRQGIGRQLWEYLKSHSNAGSITVNSSPFAVPVYHALGFTDIDKEQVTEGIRYTPMRFDR